MTTNNDSNNIKLIYSDLINSSYSDFDIRLYFLIEYQIDITMSEYQLNKKRNGQMEFKQALIDRYGSKCMLSELEFFDACHIVPYADSENMDPDNGILLNQTHHRMFDDYICSINPNTFEIEINYSKTTDKTNQFYRMIDGKKIDQLKQYNGVIKYLKLHYKKFIEKN